MDRKGQLISMDFIVSLVIVVLGLGILVQSMELNSYYAKDDQIRDELKKVGDTAAVLLVSNPEHICELADDRDIEKTLGHINYCLTKYGCITAGGSGNCPPGQTKKALREGKFHYFVDRNTLGLPRNYDCYLELIDGNIVAEDMFLTDCDTAPPASIENIYAADINVLIHGSGVNDRIDPSNLGVTGAVRKSEYLACMDANTGWCELIEGTLKLKVWKNA